MIIDCDYHQRTGATNIAVAFCAGVFQSFSSRVTTAFFLYRGISVQIQRVTQAEVLMWSGTSTLRQVIDCIQKQVHVGLALWL